MVTFTEAQSPCFKLGVESWAFEEGGVVVLYHLFELRETAIMHVGAGDSDVAKAGGDEFEFVLLLAGDLEDAEVV